MTERLEFSQDPKIQRNRWWIIIAIGLFTFMSTLDGSIVNIAIPTISRDLHVSMSQTEWVVSVYLLIICIFLLLFGKIGDIVGKIKIFKLGMIIFTIGSLLCGFNINLWTLLGARMVQALGAAMTMSTNNGIITEVFKSQERGRSLGLIGTFVALGSIAGPGLGGIILGILPWSYIFWINIPIGIFAYLLGIKVLPKDLHYQKVKIDYIGFLSFTVVLISSIVLINVAQLIGFMRIEILLLLLLFFISLIFFIKYENKISNPLVDFSLFRNRQFTISLISIFFVFIVDFAFNVVMPFYLQDLRGLDPSKAGFMMMSLPLVEIVVAPIAGRLADVFKPISLIRIGLIILIFSQVGLWLFDTTTALWFVALTIGSLGLGNGFFQSPNNSLTMESIPVQSLGVAGGLNALSRNLGMIFGISISTMILFSSMSFKAGHTVVSYVSKQPELFVFGTKVVFSTMIIILIVILAMNYLKMDQKR